MLMRTEPFRELDRLAQQAMGHNPGTWSRPTAMAMAAYRAGDRFVVSSDLPGVDPGAIELDVEHNVLTVKAEPRKIAITGTVVARTGASSGAADSTATFTDLVCADQDLLRAEFDSIIAANFADTTGRPRRLRPDTATATAALPPGRTAPPPGRHPARVRVARAQKLRARQRSPPAGQARPAVHDVAGGFTIGGGGIDRQDPRPSPHPELRR